MANVFGQITLHVLVPVESIEETLGLLQANYKVNPDRVIKWKLSCVDCNGYEEIIEVCDCDGLDLTEFID